MHREEIVEMSILVRLAEETEVRDIKLSKITQLGSEERLLKFIII